MPWFPWTVTKTDKHLKTFKVAHHHAHHMTVAKNHKPATHVKTVKVSKPVKAVVAAPAVSTMTPVASVAAKPAVKIIKASHDSKKIKVAHRHNGHVKTAKVSKPVKHANVGKVHKDVAREAKSNKVIVN